MKHEMHLDNIPFSQIKKGIKQIEYRLNDEKRQNIHVGDTIEFNNLNDSESISVTVEDLKYYKNLLEMYSDTFNLYLNQYYENPNKVVEDTPYYTSDSIKKYGCVAIYIKKI